MKTALFIDGANMHAAAKTLHFDVDFKRLITYFKDDLLRAYYYTAVVSDEDSDYQSIRPLIDWLSYNRFSLVTKQAKQWTDEVTGITKTKGNMDTEISVDALELVTNGAINHAVFFTGDGDFRYLILALQRRGCICTVVSSIATKPAICADELRRCADFFIDLVSIQDKIERTDRPERILRPRESRWEKFNG